MPLVNGPIDWRKLRLVVFDIDGTLYDQRRLRLHMMRRLLGSLLRTGDIGPLRTIRAFRKCREELSDAGVDNFLSEQYRRVAERCGVEAAEVERIVQDWIERRPLPYLARCRHPGVELVFAGLRRAGIMTAVLSDYPASHKLDALGLNADLIVSACDPDVLRLKPHPRGLQRILERACVRPRECLLIGDRFDRDAAAAGCLGVRTLIKSNRPHPTIDTFRRYTDDPFRPFLVKEGTPSSSQTNGMLSDSVDPGPAHGASTPDLTPRASK